MRLFLMRPAAKAALASWCEGALRVALECLCLGRTFWSRPSYRCSVPRFCNSCDTFDIHSNVYRKKTKWD